MQANKSNGQLTAQIQMSDHKKSGFDLSNNVLGTGRIGRIIPTRALHVMPGDTIKQDSKVAVQFEPLAVPILANMDVRQEHFYVPYNVLWKNWDKFISSGEKLDYHGVVPNVTMKRIFDIVLRYLVGVLKVIAVDYSQLTDPDERNYKAFRVNSLPIQLDAMKVLLDTKGDNFYIKDLLRPQYEAIRVWRENLQNYANEDLFIVYANTDYSNVESATNLVNGSSLNGNKYFDLIKGYLVNKMTSDSVGYTSIPTEAGLNFIIDFYNYIRSFVGYSSNIDYLNMNRMAISDLLVYCIDFLSRFTHNNEYNLADMQEFNAPLSLRPMSILHLRANYNIWFNNYRDILLEGDAMEPADGDEITADELFVLLVPRQRCWEKDAFTTALDNPGTGNVGVPLMNQYINPSGSDSSGVFNIIKVNDLGRLDYGGFNPHKTNGDYSNIAEISIDGDSWKLPTTFLSGVNPLVDIGTEVKVEGFSLYQLEAAQRAQKWLQKALFFGNRISDFYYMHFGVRFLDARLRLPELLTSSRELVKLDVVMNNTNITTEAGGEVYQSIAGDRAAYASAYDNGNSFERFCEEHGVIMSFLTIMPQVTYAYGMSRDYSRLDQFDFAFSEFATLGMDAVYSSEITNSPFEYPISVFGYQGKYYDYKAKHSEEHGELLDSQDMYTFARKFNMYDEESRPKLNYEFVHCFPSLDMFVVNSVLEDYFRYDIRYSTAAERNLPAQSIYI